MKKVIDGVAYNTETATPVARKVERFTTPTQEQVQTIYQTRSGALFEHHMITPRGDKPLEDIRRCSQAQLRRCIAEGWEAIPGASKAAEEVSTTLYLRLPKSLKARLEKAAADDDQSANTWAMRCLERCLAAMSK